MSKAPLPWQHRMPPPRIERNERRPFREQILGSGRSLGFVQYYKPTAYFFYEVACIVNIVSCDLSVNASGKIIQCVLGRENIIDAKINSREVQNQIFGKFEMR